MKRLLAIWLWLAVPFAAGQWLVWWLALDLVDLRFHAYAQAFSIPLLQAALLSRTLYRGESDVGARASVVAVLGNPWLVVLLAVDVLVITLGWRAMIDVSGMGVMSYLAAKAGIAACLALREALRARDRQARRWLGLLAAGLALWSTTYLADWLDPLSRELLRSVPRIPRWGIVYGGGLAAAVVVLLRVEETWLRDRRSAAFALEAAIAIAVSGALVVVLNLYASQELRGAWEVAVKTASCLFGTCLIAALVLRGSDTAR